MLTLKEAAAVLGVHPGTLRLWERTGAIKAYRLGKRRTYRFRVEELENFRNRKTNPPDKKTPGNVVR
jgi:excisionase family DNA binding protein